MQADYCSRISFLAARKQIVLPSARMAHSPAP
jgi:hypothetical protein